MPDPYSNKRGRRYSLNLRGNRKKYRIKSLYDNTIGCDNRSAVNDLKYTVATEACADRAAVGDALNAVLNNMNAGIQSLKDQMCQDKIDAKNERIAALENQLNMAQLKESQTAQTAQILANNAAQTQALEQYLNPAPIPAYMVQNPNCCAQNFGCGCGA